MFSNKKKEKVEPILLDRAHSVLSQAVTFVGHINTKDDLRIDGNVEGNISSEGKVVIGPSGCVTGNIESKNIELMGKIKGDIVVHDTIRLTSTSHYSGDITTLNIEIEPGARFFGNCKMQEKKGMDKEKKNEPLKVS